MDDFDNDLRQRLARLESATPGPTVAPVAHAGTQRPRRRRQLVLLLAATIAVFAITTLVVVANQPPPDPAVVAQNQADEERLRNDLGEQIADTCLTAGRGTSTDRASGLNALGLSDWTIVGDDRISEAPCVGAAPSGDVHQVWLMPSMGGVVGRALEEAKPEFLRLCLNRQEAEALLRSVLEAAGVSDPKIEIGGVQAVPIENTDAYLQHIADGCVVYSQAQWDSVGRYTWYLASR